MGGCSSSIYTSLLIIFMSISLISLLLIFNKKDKEINK